jgi:predicted PurR-regulated permease PerM
MSNSQKRQNRVMKKINPVKIVFTILLISLIILTILFYKSIFWMVMGSVVFSYILKPTVDYMEKNGLNRLVSILIVYLLIAGLLVFTALSVFPVFINQIQEMGKKIAEIAESSVSIEEFRITEVEAFNRLLKPVIDFSERTGFFDLNHLFRKFLFYLQKTAGELPQTLSHYAGKVISIFTFLFMIPTLGFFFLNDREKFRKFFFSLIPNRYFELTVLITEKTDVVLKTFFRAMMLEMLIVAVMSSIAMMIVGVPFSIVVGLLAGIGNVIPYLGPAVGIVAAIISILLSNSPLMLIISAIIALQIVQFIENRFIYPVVMGKSMEMHPMIILLTVVAGGYSMGVVGMLFAVPAVYLVKEIFLILWENLKKFEII